MGLRASGEGAQCNATSSLTVRAEEEVPGGSISAELSSKMSMLASAADSLVPIICDAAFTPSVGLTYTHKLACCPNTGGIQADKYEVSGSVGGTASIEFCLPGADGEYGTELPLGLGSGGVKYQIGPSTTLEVVGMSISASGAYVAAPCQSGCVALEYSVPFGLSVGVGVTVTAWLDPPFFSELLGTASAEATLSCGGIHISGGTTIWGTGCGSQHTEVTIGPLTASFTATVAISYDGRSADLDVSYSFDVWEGLTYP